MGPWHRIASERRLTRNQIVDAAVKIIGEGRARRADIQAIVDKMSKMCERSKRTRLRNSKIKSSLQSNTVWRCARSLP